MKIIKIAQKTKREDVPEGDIVAAYVEALNLHLRDNKIKDEKIKRLVASFPPASKIKSELSQQEIIILFESVRYAWKAVAGQDIIKESKIERAPETLQGNYWMIRKGILLEGPNHVTTIRKNMGLIAQLLDIDPFVLHEKLAGHPDGLIKTVIDHGGIRIFVNKNRKFYCQMNPTTYSNWGRNKIKKLDFKNKLVKVIDSRSQYKGWSSGISIVL